MSEVAMTAALDTNPNVRPEVGERLIIERAGGRCSIHRFTQSGGRELIQSNIAPLARAHAIALAADMGRVWIAHENRPDSIQAFRLDAESAEKWRKAA